MRIALVTCAPLPEADHDETLLMDALRAAEVDVALVPWNAQNEPLWAFDLAVLRSTWDYFLAPEEFLGWCASAARETRLFNPLEVVRWNVHKRYLLELERGGVPIVPTRVLTARSVHALEPVLAELGTEDIVVKPAISAGSWLTRRFRPGELEAAERLLHELVSARDALVQPYLASIEAGGERALVWIDGEFTHAIEKAPRFTGDPERVSDGLPVLEDERAFGERVLRASRIPLESLLYARVDIIRDADGALRLSELELIEPSLFFRQSEAALTRFVAAVTRRRPSRPR